MEVFLNFLVRMIALSYVVLAVTFYILTSAIMLPLSLIMNFLYGLKKKYF